jgi:P4 family phage/plasmid primase-like protien
MTSAAAPTPRQAAQHLWKLGANITAIPTGGKHPAHEWNNPNAPWATERQPDGFVASLKWPTVPTLYNARLYPAIETVGVICGINGWRWIDVDARRDADGNKIAVPPFVRDALLDALDLPDDYEWVGRSKSGLGWHIAIRCDGALPAAIADARSADKANDGGGAGVKIGTPREGWAAMFDHIELRWEHCQTILPGTTSYNGHIPTEPPAVVTVDQVVNAFLSVAEPKRPAVKATPTSPRATAAPSERFVWDTATDDAITQAFDLVAWFVAELGGDTQPEGGGEVRILGHNGLMVNEPRREWYILGEETGGGWVKAIAYTRYGGQVPTGAAWFGLVQTAADFSGVQLRSAVAETTPPRTRQEAPRAARTPEPTKDTRAVHNTDLGNAERLVAAHGHRMRYVDLWAKWLIYEDGSWIMDDTGAAARLARDVVRGMYADAAHIDDDSERKGVVKWALASESASRLHAMLDLARHEDGIAAQHTALDADPWTLNVANGTLDLRTGRLRPHDPADMITKRIAVAYDPAATCPIWDAFMRAITCQDDALATYMQRAAGYSLGGDTSEQCLFFCYGAGSNGKSTFIDTLSLLLAPYMAKIPTDSLMRRRGDAGIPNDVARLAGRRMVVAAEMSEGERFDEGKIKDLTGNDLISARFMRGEWFDFRPQFKLWMYGNHRPGVRGTDNGIWRRLRVLPFNATFADGDKDPTLPTRLRAELPGILAWCVRGCLDWQRHGLPLPETVAEATDGYRSEMDTLGSFLADSCTLHPGDAGLTVQAAALYRAYVQWCEDGGEYAVSQKRLGLQLQERGCRGDRRAGARIWRGICLGVFDAPTEDDSEI